MGHKTKSEQLHKELNKFAEIFSPNPRFNDVCTEIDFGAKFNELYNQSLEDLYFWQYCPFKVYELTYKRRLEEYQLIHPDALEIDFCLHELKKINEYIRPVELTYYLEKSTSGESFFYYMLSSEFYEKAIQLDFLPERFYLDFKYSTQRKINLLESLIKEAKDKQRFETIKLSETSGKENDKDNNDTSEIKNPYPRIFKNENAFELFEYLKKNVRNNSKLADYSFIYRMMQKDGLIYENIKDAEFRDWLQRNFDVILSDKTKTLDRCSTQPKEKLYQTAKILFQPY